MLTRRKFWRWVLSFFDQGTLLPLPLRYLYKVLFPIDNIKAGYDPRTDTFWLINHPWSAMWFHQLVQGDTRWFRSHGSGVPGEPIVLETRDWDQFRDHVAFVVNHYGMSDEAYESLCNALKEIDS